jgi:DNA invertase Pin-like site-specific DNA recombinase
MLDTYIRVSRVNDREGAEYRSPDLQRDDIRRWFKQHDLKAGKEVIDEDTSGGVPQTDRGIEELLRRAEAGESEGIVTSYFKRFGRNHIENLKAVKRLKDAGARLVCVKEGIDSDQANSKWLIDIMSLQAEEELERITEGWAHATSAAVDEGQHIACRAPIGYLRADQANPQYDAKGDLIRNARLVEDPATAEAIRQAFVMRSEGVSYGEILKTIPRRITKSTLAAVFKNRAYLGEARGPNGAVKKDAHPALTTPALFSVVQPGKKRAPTGLANGALLGGLITCAECGHKLRILGSTRRDTGERFANYVCAKHYAAGDCPSPAIATVALVDEHVKRMLMDAWDEVSSLSEDAHSAWLEANDRLKQAEAALDDWVSDVTIQRTLTKQRFQRGIVDRQDAVDEAQRALWAMPDPDIEADKPIVRIDGKPMLYEVWGDDPAADRRHLRRHIASVTLKKADRRRRWQPIEERVEVRWVGQNAVATASLAAAG